MGVLKSTFFDAGIAMAGTRIYSPPLYIIRYMYYLGKKIFFIRYRHPGGRHLQKYVTIFFR